MTGVAFAQPKADPKAAPKAAPKADAKPADAKAPAMEMPKPPAELEQMAKIAAGTWRCTGTETGGDGTANKMTATVKAKVDLNKWWIAESMEAKGAKSTYKAASYTTYDANAKKWRRVSVDSYGGHMIGTSDGMKDNKLDWNLDMVGPMGTGQFRDHMDMTDKKAGLKMWGEMSMDKGKTWNKVYEMTCKK